MREPPMPPGMDSTMIIGSIPEPSIVIIMSIMSIPGMHCHASMNRWRIRSNLPPMTALATPMTTEITVERIVQVMPRMTEVRAP